MTNADTALLTVDEVCERLRVSRSTVYRRLASGEIPAVRLGSWPKAPLRVLAGELEAWLYAEPGGAHTDTTAAGL